MHIKFDNVSKIYPRPNGKYNMVLKDISFSINPGDFIVILGESGCGKTSLLNMLAGFEMPSSGRILANGKEIQGIHPSRSMLFQKPALIPWLNVKKNVAYGCRLRGDIEKLDYRVNQFIEIIGLSGFEKTKPEELSLGMAQRVCMARALVGHPKVLIMDEPFASLDTFTQAHIQEELVNIWLSEKFTSIFVTHDIEEAIFLGNKIILLGGYPGSIQEIFTIDDKYPRDFSSPTFNEYRINILKKFKTSYVGNKRFF